MSDQPVVMNDTRNRWVQEAMKGGANVQQTGERPREDQVRHLPGGLNRVAHEAGAHSGFVDGEIRAGSHLLNHVATHRERDSQGRLVLREEYAERDESGELLGSRDVVWAHTEEASGAARAMGYGGPGVRSRQLVESRFTSAKQFAISLPDDYEYGPNSPHRKES